MFKTEVEPRAAGDCFHCRVLKMKNVIDLFYAIKTCIKGKICWYNQIGNQC